MIFRTLEWLGIDWDDEPEYQSRRRDLYAEAAEKLLADGRAYLCDCTRDAVKARAEARGGKPGYDGFCRDRDVQPGEGVVVRFRTPDEGVTAFTDLIRGEVSFPNADLEDFVIRRANGAPMFLLANAVDDAEHGHHPRPAGRGPAQRHAQGDAAAPRPRPHRPTRSSPTCRSSSTSSARSCPSARTTSRSTTTSPAATCPRRWSTTWPRSGGVPPDGVEIRPMAEIVELFDLDRRRQPSAFFDLKKLEHFNGEYIRALPVDEFIERSQPWLLADDAPWAAERFDAATFAAMAPLVQERVKTLAEVPGYVDFLFLAEPGSTTSRGRRRW